MGRQLGSSPCLRFRYSGVADLDARRVAEHVGAEIARGGGAVDAAAEAGFDERGEGSRVIDVGVREDDGVGGDGFGGELGVAGARFLAATLVHAAVDEEGAGGGGDEVHRAGDFLGGAEEADGNGHGAKVDDSQEVQKIRRSEMLGG